MPASMNIQKSLLIDTPAEHKIKNHRVLGNYWTVWNDTERDLTWLYIITASDTLTDFIMRHYDYVVVFNGWFFI